MSRTPSPPRPFAVGTAVPVAKSRAEIETLVHRHGADAFMTATDGPTAVVVFRARGLLLQFELTLPQPGERRFTHRTPGNNRPRGADVARKTYEAELRRLWRALLLAIKAKFEVAASGIETFESSFLANIVLAGSETVGHRFLPQIEAMKTGAQAPTRLLPPGTNGSPR